MTDPWQNIANISEKNLEEAFSAVAWMDMRFLNHLNNETIGILNEYKQFLPTAMQKVGTIFLLCYFEVAYKSLELIGTHFINNPSS